MQPLTREQVEAVMQELADLGVIDDALATNRDRWDNVATAVLLSLSLKRLRRESMQIDAKRREEG